MFARFGPVCHHFETVLRLNAIKLGRILLALLFTTMGWPCSAQTFDFEHSHAKSMSLDGQMRFHIGDDPEGKLGWADSAFDDSRWPLLGSGKTWSEQGYKGISGFAWYRFKVLLPAHSDQLALLIPRLSTSYQIFADGQMIGQFGGMPPRGRYVMGFDQIFPIPSMASSVSHPITVAIRVWNMDWFARYGGGFDGIPTIGEISNLRSIKTQNDWGRFWSNASGNVLMLMNLVAAFAGFFLFCMRTADREYLWFALYELLTGVQHLCADWVLFYPAAWKAAWLLDDTLAAASWFFFLVFVFKILNGSRNWLFWAAVGTSIITFAGAMACVAQLISREQWRVAALLCLFPYFACILVLLYRKARQGVADARLMLLPVAACYSSWFAILSLGLLNAHGQTWVGRDFGWLLQLSRWPFPFSFQDIADMVMLLAVLAVLPLRFARSRRDEERLSGEIESARMVQQVLIPTEIPKAAGFDIQCVYKPAGQVGGDFFQIIPIAAGGLLVAIGDVSGKGLPAAMTVSLLVGTVRTLAHYTQSPAEILAAMNQRMLGRSKGGFTTCLILRVDSDGTLSAANAGHLAPYYDGSEVMLENSLPLGLAGNASYVEKEVSLAPGAQLTLVTDGVVEARDDSGMLFGFERAAAISRESAESIAKTAQQFGQEDDITVLTLSRLAATNASAPQTRTPALI